MSCRVARSSYCTGWFFSQLIMSAISSSYSGDFLSSDFCLSISDSSSSMVCISVIRLWNCSSNSPVSACSMSMFSSDHRIYFVTLRAFPVLQVCCLYPAVSDTFRYVVIFCLLMHLRSELFGWLLQLLLCAIAFLRCSVNICSISCRSPICSHTDTRSFCYPGCSMSPVCMAFRILHSRAVRSDHICRSTCQALFLFRLPLSFTLMSFVLFQPALCRIYFVLWSPDDLF